jgi:hypothetical protein
MPVTAFPGKSSPFEGNISVWGKTPQVFGNLDNEIRGEVLAQGTLLTLKQIYDPKLASRLPEIFALLHELANKETALEYLETLLRYLSAAAEHVTKQELVQTVETALRGKGDEIMPTSLNNG